MEMFNLYGTDHGIFTSLVSNTNDVFCMDFNPKDPKYPDELINDCFRREIKYLSLLEDYPWRPENLTVDFSQRKIYFKWHGNTCNDFVPSGYAEQLEQIARDLDRQKIYKPSFYPKYFYTDSYGRIHAFAFYSCSDYSEQPIAIDFYKPILNPDRLAIVNELAVDGKLDIGHLIKRGFNEYIEWPNNPLPDIYRRVYGQ